MGGDRKQDHITLSREARIEASELDPRFDYEPLLARPQRPRDLETPFLGRVLQAPLWISSLTGGTPAARQINLNLARACRRFGLGMGLGSCRRLLTDRSAWGDFALRQALGEDRPLYANLGIAQVEELVTNARTHLIRELVETLEADGLIVHINPLQEWIQPEGDRLERPPLETLQRLLEQMPLKVIVKEVGQGFGPASLEALLGMPLEAIEFGAFGGTNFVQLELLRRSPEQRGTWEPLARVGHSAPDMVRTLNRLLERGVEPLCRQVIISGGVRNALDGHHLTSLCPLPSVFGMAAALLEPARQGPEALDDFLAGQLQLLRVARSCLRAKP
nr:hypothetical protein [uncultured Holophaga sp.]